MVVHYVVIAPRRTSSSQPDCSCPLVSRGSASPLALQILFGLDFGLVYLVCLVGPPPTTATALLLKHILYSISALTTEPRVTFYHPLTERSSAHNTAPHRVRHIRVIHPLLVLPTVQL